MKDISIWDLVEADLRQEEEFKEREQSGAGHQVNTRKTVKIPVWTVWRKWRIVEKRKPAENNL